jgi:membrane protease YdiL (CAAX protease family)
MAAAVALSLVTIWTLGADQILRLVRLDRRGLSEGLGIQIAGNALVGIFGLVLLIDTDGAVRHFVGRLTLSDLAAAVLGVAVSVPGSALVASVVHREVVPMELEIRRLPMGFKLVTLALVPLSEEVLWRAIGVGALVAIGLVVSLSALLGVMAHRNAFAFHDLVKGVAPSSVGIALAFGLSHSLWVATIVHVAVDLEILTSIRDPAAS